MSKRIFVLDIVGLCESRWEMEVDIKPTTTDSGDRYKGCMAMIPWYLLDKEVKYWFCNDRTMEITIEED